MTRPTSDEVTYIPRVLCPRCLREMSIVENFSGDDYLHCEWLTCPNGNKYRIPTMNLEIIPDENKTCD